MEELLARDIVKEFDCKVRNLSPRTTKHYVNNVKRMFKFFETEFQIEAIGEITHQHIKAYIECLKYNDLSESYINTILKSVRAFYNYCQIEEYVTRNPCPKSQMAKGKEESHHNVY